MQRSAIQIIQKTNQKKVCIHFELLINSGTSGSNNNYIALTK